MVQAVNETPDPIFSREVSNYLDLSKVAVQLALENFVAEDDGLLGYSGMNNFYLYRFEDTTRSQFLPWDKDNTFHSVDFDILKRVDENVLARRTLAIAEHRTTYFNTLLGAAASAMEPDPEAAATDEDGNEISRPGGPAREGRLTFARERAAFVENRVAEQRR
jgi:hypothetical protein